MGQGKPLDVSRRPGTARQQRQLRGIGRGELPRVSLPGDQRRHRRLPARTPAGTAAGAGAAVTRAADTRRDPGAGSPASAPSDPSCSPDYQRRKNTRPSATGPRPPGPGPGTGTGPSPGRTGGRPAGPGPSPDPPAGPRTRQHPAKTPVTHALIEQAQQPARPVQLPLGRRAQRRADQRPGPGLHASHHLNDRVTGDPPSGVHFLRPAQVGAIRDLHRAAAVEGYRAVTPEHPRRPLLAQRLGRDLKQRLHRSGPDAAARVTQRLR
jgi:hypothetical protein